MCHTIYFSFLLPGRRLLALVAWQDYLFSVPSLLLCVMCSNDLCFLLWLEFFVDYISDTRGCWLLRRWLPLLARPEMARGRECSRVQGQALPPPEQVA